MTTNPPSDGTPRTPADSTGLPDIAANFLGDQTPRANDGRADSPDAASHPNVPKRLGAYLRGEELGHGGMGIVFRATHERLGTPCAVKVLIAGEHASPVSMQRFAQEAALVAKMGRHPNIVSIYDLGNDGTLMYYAMDLVEGVTLRARCRKPLLAFDVAGPILEKVARALHYAHQHGVLHRDVKPDNILLREGPLGIEPLLMDFGLAKDLSAEESLSATGQVVGTPSYMSPEQARGEDLDPRTDIYSLGAVMYELLTGVPPHKGKTASEKIAAVLKGEVVSPRTLRTSIPRDLDTVCMKCLEKGPERRYQTAEALADDLARFRMGDPVKARRASLARRAWAAIRRHPTRVGLITAGLIALGAVGVLTVVPKLRDWHAESTRHLAVEKARNLSETLEQNKDIRGAVKALLDAIGQANPEEREALVDRMATLAVGLGIFSDESEETWEMILQVAPDHDFGIMHFQIAHELMAGLRRRHRDLNDGAINEQKKAERAVDQLRKFIQSKHGDPQDKEVARKEIAEILDAITPVDLPYPTEEQIHADWEKGMEDTSIPALDRVTLAYQLGVAYREKGDNARAYQKFARAWELLREDHLIYMWHYGDARGWEGGPRERSTLEVVEQSLRRIDNQPDEMQGGIEIPSERIAEAGPAEPLPKEWKPSVIVTVRRAETRKGEEALQGLRFAPNKSLLGVVDGEYVVSLRDGRETLDRAQFEAPGARYELDFSAIPKDLKVTVKGKWEVLPPVRVKKIGEMKAEAPEKMDAEKDCFTWTEVAGAKEYRLNLGIELPPTAEGLAQSVYDRPTVKALSIRLVDLEAGWRRDMITGRKVYWSVDALDDSGNRLATSGPLRTITLQRGLEK